MRNRVLAVDDDAGILEIISYILIENGYKIATLSNGAELFERIRQFQPNLVLMDVMLGKMDGRQLCRELKHCPDTNFIPVILISGLDSLSASFGDEDGPDDFLSKPFNISELIEKIDRQLT